MSHLLRPFVVRGSILCALVGCAPPAPEPGQAAPQPAAAQDKAVAEAAVKEAPKEVAQAEVKAPEAPPAAITRPPVTLETKLEVEACDDYVTRYRACLEAVPSRVQGAHEQALLAQLTAWAIAKDDAKLAGALPGECAAAATAARASTRVLGCVWREGDSSTPEIPKGGKGKPRGDRVPRDLKDPFEGF